MDDQRTLDTLSLYASRTIGQRLLFWTIRWLIGFTIIWVVVRQWPTSSWLWWAGGVVAALSLVATLMMHVVLQRKITSVQQKLGDAQRLATAIDSGARGTDPDA